MVLRGRLGCDVTCTHSSCLCGNVNHELGAKISGLYGRWRQSAHTFAVYTEIMFAFASLYSCFASSSIVSKTAWSKVKILYITIGHNFQSRICQTSEQTYRS